MALVTAAEARLHIPGLTGTSEDTNLDTVIARVGVVFARWCGYPAASAGGTPTMESAAYTRYTDGPGGRALVLDIWPVTTIASIYDSPDRSYGSGDLVSSSDYSIIEGERGLVELSSTASHGTWSTGQRAIKATYTAGYATVPADLKLAACLAVRAVWSLRNEQGKTNVAQAGISVGLRDEEVIIEAAAAVLWPYRLPRVLL